MSTTQPALSQADTFADLIPEARAFLSDLAINNARDWFNAHKPIYNERLRAPAILLLDQFAGDLGLGTGTKLFRPQRDVRFSKDKTPYQTHLHMLRTLPEAGRAKPGIFFGIAPDYVSVGGGVMGFDKETMQAWRGYADGSNGDSLLNLLDDLTAQGLRIGEPELKRVPSPFGQDHSNSDLLRRKSLTVWRDLPETEFAAPLAALRNIRDRLAPLFEHLRSL